MNIIKLICLSLLLLTGILPGAQGQAAWPDINPALFYYQAFLVAPDPVSEADRNYMWSKKGLEQGLPDRFGPIVAGYDNQFLLVRRAAQATAPCDWGVDLSPSGAGPNTLIPFLGRARAVAQTAQLRAIWALQHGRQDDARDDLLATFVLARNAASCKIPLGPWVQHSIESMEYGTIAEHFGEISPEILQQLVAGFDAAPVSPTVADCMSSEKAGIYDWAMHKVLELQKAYPHDDAKVLAGFRASGYGGIADFTGDTNFWPQFSFAAGGTAEGLLRLIHEMEPLFPRIATILTLPQPEFETQWKQFLAEGHQSPNPFIADYLLAWEKFNFRAREFRGQAQLAMIHAAVEYKSHGESGFKSVMDPFGNGPFTFQRFKFKGTDRGFQLKSAYAGDDAPFTIIFVEKRGAAFQISGADAGKPVTE